jgi:hypothetical protein
MTVGDAFFLLQRQFRLFFPVGGHFGKSYNFE